MASSDTDICPDSSTRTNAREWSLISQPPWMVLESGTVAALIDESEKVFVSCCGTDSAVSARVRGRGSRKGRLSRLLPSMGPACTGGGDEKGGATSFALCDDHSSSFPESVEPEVLKLRLRLSPFLPPERLMIGLDVVRASLRVRVLVEGRG